MMKAHTLAETPPSCPIPNCFVSSCTTKAITEVDCVAGQCVFKTDCDASHVACASMPPSCKPDEVPQVSGMCWTHQCIKASYCPSVPSCADCDPAAYACVTLSSKLQTHHCVSVPPDCAADVSCGCLGDAICQGYYTICNDITPPPVAELACGCPTC